MMKQYLAKFITHNPLRFSKHSSRLMLSKTLKLKPTVGMTSDIKLPTFKI